MFYPLHLKLILKQTLHVKILIKTLFSVYIKLFSLNHRLILKI